MSARVSILLLCFLISCFLLPKIYLENVLPCFGGSITARVKSYIPKSTTPEPIEIEVYNNLATYAHLIDISYCIDNYHQIEKPFQCELCDEFSPDMSLVSQWYLDDSVCGYISTTLSNLFDSQSTVYSENRKTIIVSLRGTRSVYDTITDFKVDMVDYKNPGVTIPVCGPRCRVHNGFWSYYRNTLEIMESALRSEIDISETNYELVFVGHSLGGSVALLLALHFLDLGYSNLTLVTMGQPLVGNKDFTTWADEVMGSSEPLKHNSFVRKYARVVHKGDVVSTIPRNGRLFEHYHSFQNQVYLNVSSDTEVPSPEQVVDCYSDKNPHCITGDSTNPFNPLSDIYHNHNTYFRRMGLCGMHL